MSEYSPSTNAAAAGVGARNLEEPAQPAPARGVLDGGGGARELVAEEAEGLADNPGVKHRSNTGQILVKCWSNAGPRRPRRRQQRNRSNDNRSNERRSSYAALFIRYLYSWL
jgi:hypothetical protein